MMADQPQVEALGDHDYLILVRQGEDIVEVRVHATPAVINRITSVETDDTRIIEATAA